MKREIIENPVYKYLPRACKKCRMVKEWYDFPGGIKNRLWCKKCWAKHQGEYLKRNPLSEADKETNWGSRLKSRYGITREEYYKLLDSQMGACAMCMSNRSKTKRRLAVDHCHKTGRVRGLLCDLCNRGIGLLLENPLLCKIAALYLEKSAIAVKLPQRCKHDFVTPLERGDSRESGSWCRHCGERWAG